MMRVFSVLGVLFYAGILILIGIGLIVFSFNLFQPEEINGFINYVTATFNARLIIGLSGFMLVLISFSFAKLILGRFQREKTIAFTTASGEVTIALSAVEDLIKHLVFVIPEIKELRPDVIATKKGVLVALKVVLKSGASIPDVTARLQDITKTKIQEALGLEEDIIIRIHIIKIIPKEEKDKKRKEIERDEPNIPFGGYGRI
jgi:hypothetical protein